MHDSDKLNYETLHLIPNKKKNTKITHEIKYKMSSKIKHGHGKANQDYDDEYDDQYYDDDEYDDEYDDNMMMNMMMNMMTNMMMMNKCLLHNMKKITIMMMNMIIMMI
eukprot:398462_1